MSETAAAGRLCRGSCSCTTADTIEDPAHCTTGHTKPGNGLLTTAVLRAELTHSADLNIAFFQIPSFYLVSLSLLLISLGGYERFFN